MLFINASIDNIEQNLSSNLRFLSKTCINLSDARQLLRMCVLALDHMALPDLLLLNLKVAAQMFVFLQHSDRRINDLTN